MSRYLYPRAAGKGPITLGGVVFTDGAAEADLGPHRARLLQLLGAIPVQPAEVLDEHTVDELREIAAAGGLHIGSHLHKADVIRVLRGEKPTDHAAEAKGSQIVDVEPAPESPAGAVESVSAPTEPTPTEISPEPVASDLSEDTEHHEEDTWPRSPASTTSPTTTGSLSLQERRHQSSQGA